jgi:hypothetical protein
VRGPEGADPDVVVFKTLGAPRRHMLRDRRARRVGEADGSDPEPVAVTRVTVVPASGFEGAEEAKRWLERCRGDEQLQQSLTEEALQLVNRAVHAHRVAAADPYVHDVTRAQAQRVRVGYGTGTELIDARSSQAYDLPLQPGRRARRALLAPQEELAGILGRRRRVHVSEDLALRARMDLDQGRSAQAALQLAAAIEALAAELEREQESHPRLDAVARRRDAARELSREALEGSLSDERADELSELLAELERGLRRRRHL